MELVGPSSPIMIIRLTRLLIGNVLGFLSEVKINSSMHSLSACVQLTYHAVSDECCSNHGGMHS